MTYCSGLQNLYRLHSDSQSKYVYFPLAAAGAALGYGLQKLDGVPFSWWATPGLLSLAFLLSCFFCGCKRITWVHSAIYANHALLQLRHGLHPEQPPHPQWVQLAMESTSTAIQRNINKTRIYMTLQFAFLGLGVISFVVWRLLEMARVTFAA